MASPEESVLDLIFGRWRSQTLYAGVKLGVFDALGEQPQGSDALAASLGLDATLLYRLLRALGTLGLVQEDTTRRFALTPAGALLRADHPQTLRGMTLLEEGPAHYALWKHLPAMVTDGKQNAFVREFGQMAFDYAAQNAEYGAVFNEAMSSYSSTQTAWALDALSKYDFSALAHVCDVGGGQGHLLCSLLAKYPHLRGTVLELPAVIARRELLWAERMGVADRCEYIGGDMFTSVPPADAYFMKMIIHDWNDDESVQLLGNLRATVTPEGRVFLVEHVVPGPESPHFAKLFDIHMMCWGTGRERTVDEYRTLLERSGWTYVQTLYPQAGAMAVVEGAAE
jgi:hypothetical protein